MSTSPTPTDASPRVSPGDSSQSSGAIVPIAGHTDFDGETEASENTEAAASCRAPKGSRSLLSTGKQRALARQAQERPLASLSSPETIAEHLLEAVRVERSGEGTTDFPLPPAWPEHFIDTVMVAELAEHARKLLKERARQDSESGGDGSGGASGSGAEETARTAAAEGKGEGGGEGKDTASSSGSSSQTEGVAPFELAIGGGESDGTAEESQATSAAVPWASAPVLGRLAALRKRPGRVVKLVPVEKDTKGTESCKDGSIILRDETMFVDRVLVFSPRLGKCLVVGFWLIFAVALLSAAAVLAALPFAILKFTNTTDVLFGPRVANASSAAAASALNISNTTSDHNGPPWWVGVNV